MIGDQMCGTSRYFETFARIWGEMCEIEKKVKIKNFAVENKLMVNLKLV